MLKMIFIPGYFTIVVTTPAHTHPPNLLKASVELKS